jgi:hypothetical protein
MYFNSSILIWFSTSFSQLTEKNYGCFQQDSGTARTVCNCMTAISDVFGDGIISGCLRQARSPDLMSCDFYLWGGVKDCAYKRKCRTLQELEENILEEISSISPAHLQHVHQSVLSRCSAWLRAQEEYFNATTEPVSLSQSLFCFLLPRSQWPGSRKKSQSCPECDSALGGPWRRKQSCSTKYNLIRNMLIEKIFDFYCCGEK